MAARVSKPGAFRVDAARILEGVDARALGGRIERVSDHLMSRATEKKENERKTPEQDSRSHQSYVRDASAEFDRPGETSVG
jgi:hypothetical protein